MDEESCRIFDRMYLHRLIAKHQDWSNARLAREIGRSEAWVSKWRFRLLNPRVNNFEKYLSESRAPKIRHGEVDTYVEDIICDLREELTEHYGRPAGPVTIIQALEERTDLIDEGLLRSSVLEGMINEEILVQDSEAKGLFVSDMAVDNYIRNIEQFQVDGQFSNERMQALLRNAGLTLQAYRESLKSQFVLGQARSGLIASAFVLNDEQDSIVALDRQTRSFGVATIFKRDYLKSISVTDDEVEEYFESHKSEFKKPENVDVSYVQLKRDDLENEIQVSEKDLDLVFIPLLISDEQNYRIGYGKGFYDRFLANCRKDILKIGLNFFKPISIIDDINKFDIPLDLVICPANI